jgi:hypothetical protein
MAATILIVLGDSAIESFCEGRLHERAGDQIIFVTSMQPMAATLERRFGARANRLQVVYLEKPEGVSDEHWDDQSLLTADERRFRFDDPARYRTDSTDGAASRPGAAMRGICSRDLPAAFTTAFTQVAVPPADADGLQVHVVVIATAYRMTGSAALPPLLGHLYRWSRDIRRVAQMRVDLIIGAPSVIMREPAKSQGQQARLGVYGEIAVAEALQIEVGPALYVGQGMIAHIIEVGLPGHRNGMLRDDVQARRAYALAVRCFLLGATAREFRARFPHSTLAVTQRRAESGELMRFSGLGAMEVVLEPAAAREFLQAHLLATAPTPAGAGTS